MTRTISDLRQGLKEVLSAEGIPFMDDRTPSKLEHGEVVTITDYAYITNDEGTYPVFCIKENDKHFYFGGLVFKQLFMEIDKFSKKERQDLLEEGLKISIEEKTSKKGRNYTKVNII